VAVRDRETIILGGFIRSSEDKAKSGVPYLKDIPLLGYLFNKTSRTSERKELLVLMRPTVLRTPELAAAHTAAEKLRLPGISEADIQDKEAEERSVERAKRRIEAGKNADLLELLPKDEPPR
jgi:general secretion pathway protein D